MCSSCSCLLRRLNRSLPLLSSCALLANVVFVVVSPPPVVVLQLTAAGAPPGTKKSASPSSHRDALRCIEDRCTMVVAHAFRLHSQKFNKSISSFFLVGCARMVSSSSLVDKRKTFLLLFGSDLWILSKLFFFPGRRKKRVVVVVVVGDTKKATRKVSSSSSSFRRTTTFFYGRLALLLEGIVVRLWCFCSFFCALF